MWVTLNIRINAFEHKPITINTDNIVAFDGYRVYTNATGELSKFSLTFESIDELNELIRKE